MCPFGFEFGPADFCWEFFESSEKCPLVVHQVGSALLQLAGDLTTSTFSESWGANSKIVKSPITTEVNEYKLKSD